MPESRSITFPKHRKTKRWETNNDTNIAENAQEAIQSRSTTFKRTRGTNKDETNTTFETTVA